MSELEVKFRIAVALSWHCCNLDVALLLDLYRRSAILIR